MERLRRQAEEQPDGYDATVLAWIERLRCFHLAEQRIPSYRILIEEFYTTHEEEEAAIVGGDFRCRLNGMEINVTKEILSDVLGSDCSIYVKPDHHRSYKENEFRRKLSNKNPGTESIMDDPFFTTYKFLAGVVLGNRESSKIAKEEIYQLLAITIWWSCTDCDDVGKNDVAFDDETAYLDA